MVDESVAVCWFRRDLRLADHPALAAAAASGPVAPLFVHDPALARPAGADRLAFLHRTLDSLALDVRAIDPAGGLAERVGDPTEVVAAFASEVGAREVHVTGDFGPYGLRRDGAVAAALARRGMRLVATASPYAVDPGTIRTKAGGPYRVFTPFSRAWRAHGWALPLPVPPGLRWASAVRSDPRPVAPGGPGLERWPAGERAAWEAAEAFVHQRLDGYSHDRDRPDLDATSRLSPHLKVGSIHPRQLLALLGDDQDATTFATELCWRDFYADVLLHQPESARRNLVASMDGLRWDVGALADERFDAWAAGTTGYPIVDAGMRQLLSEGWIHNRVRMIVASFLVKDLHLDWRRGARWFMAHLVDGDLASNQHGWQWVAGTGTDAAPFFRVFNPVAQGKRFDPNGDYVRRHVPELADVAGAAVHEPWLLGGGLLHPTPSYPDPIVDHASERAEALARYERR